MARAVYVIGHKNPDTDSVVSAIAYAELKNHDGDGRYQGVRAGKLNPQTAYILNRFSVDAPPVVSDLTPKVKYYMTEKPVYLHENESLWNALTLLEKENFKMVPIVSDSGEYVAALHYNAFAQNMIKKVSPERSKIIATSIDHLMATLKAQPVTLFNTAEMFDSRMLVIAMEKETFREYLEAEPPGSTVVIVGNREDIQEHAIDYGVRALIITGGKVISTRLKKKAEENGVSVLISPFGTARTSWLSIYSTPVSKMGDYTLKPVSPEDYLSKIQDELNRSISRCLPVVDENNQLTGILSQGDIMRPPAYDIIMVDHNESAQAVDGIEHFRIREIIDHHRLGNLHTDYPITFMNRPVGSTATIIADLYKKNHVPLSRTTASLLLAGILSDTVLLKSATTTDEDRRISEYLALVAGLDIEEFGNEIMSVSSAIMKKQASEILETDIKEYRPGKHLFTVSQIEVVSPDVVLERKQELLSALAHICKSRNALFSALMVTDITKLNSYLLLSGSHEFITSLEYPLFEENTYLLRNILSRKKQLLPYLLEKVKKFG